MMRNIDIKIVVMNLKVLKSYSISFIIKRAYYHLLLKKNIICDHNTTIFGCNKITTHGKLIIGKSTAGFLHGSDHTYLNIQGNLEIEDNVCVGQGYRIDRSKGGRIHLSNCTINGQTNLIIAHELRIGSGSAISWGCEFLDEDWHTLQYIGKQEKEKKIIIGSHVWVGSHSKILKGVSLGDGCVVAARSVVTRSFPPQSLIGGNPAKLIRQDMTWD